ncbi:MAG: TolC family protein, partial [Myxococcota bacterium]|nr:TolC family protein [Myxococcota bacterium]
MRSSLLILTAALQASCAMHTVAPTVVPPVELPEAFSAADSSEDASQGPWWSTFNEPGLSEAVETALRTNRDLLAAWSRVEQAAIVARQAGAGWWPRVEASVGAGVTQTSLFFGDEVPSFIDSTVRSESFPMSLGVNYEVDLWGRVRSLTNASAEEGG